MKSYESIAFTIYDGIFADAAIRWPNLQSQLRKDLSYLRRAVEQRGLPFLTITLPSAGKAFFKRLDFGSSTCGDGIFPQGFPHDKSGRPRFLGGLHDLVFNDEGVLRSDVDIEAVKFMTQIFFLCKNARLDCHPSKVKETLDEFFAIEERLPISHSSTWDDNVPEWSERSGHPLWGGPARTDGSAEQAVLFGSSDHDHYSSDLPWDSLRAHARWIIRQWIGDYPEWELEPKHGPGAVSEVRKGGVKFDFPNWPTKLEDVFPYDWYGSGSLWNTSRPDDREIPSRLIAVPKSQKGPRLICAEPTCHQWIQQGIWRWLEAQVDRSPIRDSIRFRDQTLQQRRALSASSSGELCTIDLSSASDRISTRLVEYIFQDSNILNAFHASRTRTMIQNISADHPKMIKLRKFSTMGSAVTFPVQSLIFYILTTWALSLHDELVKAESEGYTPDHNWFRGMSFKRLADVSIFGDDIIAPVDAYQTIELVLHECGLKVNDSKTYTGSNFRESCGMYAFKGIDISPAYLLEPYDGSPSSLAATIEASNNFHLRGYWNGAENVVSQIPEVERKNLYVTGPDRTGGLGLVSFCGDGFHLLKSKWDRDLQREYIKVLTVTSKSQRTKGPGEACLSQYFFEKPDPEALLPWSSGQARRPKLRKCFGRVYR